MPYTGLGTWGYCCTGLDSQGLHIPFMWGWTATGYIHPLYRAGEPGVTPIQNWTLRGYRYPLYGAEQSGVTYSPYTELGTQALYLPPIQDWGPEVIPIYGWTAKGDICCLYRAGNLGVRYTTYTGLGMPRLSLYGAGLPGVTYTSNIGLDRQGLYIGPIPQQVFSYTGVSYSLYRAGYPGLYTAPI